MNSSYPHGKLALFAIGTCVFLASVFSVQAQTPSAQDPLPSEDTIESWLHSGEPRLEAWGAHYALITHDGNLVPDLVALATEWQPLNWQTCDTVGCSVLSSEEWEEREAMATTLDALIQLNGDVSPEALRNLAPDFPSYVAVLLARLPSADSNDLDLELYHSPPEHGELLQYVSAALLARRSPYGFAADLLASIHIHATIVLVLPGSTADGIGSGEGCGFGGTGPLPPDWPMTGQYVLSSQKTATSSEIVDGVDPLYAARIELGWYIGEPSDMCQQGWLRLDPSARLRLIADMLEVSPKTIPWQTSVFDRIEFKSVDQADSAILTFIEEQQGKYRQTANALADRALLLRSDIEISLPEIQIEIQDMRGPASVPINLPDLPPRTSWYVANR